MYGILAEYYDRLMSHVDYEALADYMAGFAGERRRGLDLACGTGRFTQLLCQRGFDMVATDASAAMLSEAQSRDCGALFLRQGMTNLDLFGTVDVAFCTMDGLNYLTADGALRRCMERVSLFLEPGGVFIFDMHHPRALLARDGRSYSTECGDAFGVWDCQVEGVLCRQRLTLFCREEGSRWNRHTEWHAERAYTPEEVDKTVKLSGFTDMAVYGMYTERPPEDGDERLLFVAKK